MQTSVPLNYTSMIKPIGASCTIIMSLELKHIRLKAFKLLAMDMLLSDQILYQSYNCFMKFTA